MSVAKYPEITPEYVRPGLERRIIYTPNLMTVVVDFTDGPWAEAEPFHSHPHEQTCYIAFGEVMFFCEGEQEQHLCPGDMFAVPSGKKHTVKILTEKARLIDSFNPIRQDFIK
jgi:quercetin dioxygenase-like cupin family protein